MKYCTNCNSNNDPYNKKCWNCNKTFVDNNNNTQLTARTNSNWDVSNFQLPESSPSTYQQNNYHFTDDRTVINLPQNNNLLQTRMTEKMLGLSIQERDSKSEEKLLSDKYRDKEKLRQEINNLEKAKEI